MKPHKWAKSDECYTCGKPFLSQTILQSGFAISVCDCNMPATKGQIREIKNLILKLGKIKLEESNK